MDINIYEDGTRVYMYSGWNHREKRRYMKVNLLDERGHDRPDEKKARQTAVGHPVICAPRIIVETMTK